MGESYMLILIRNLFIAAILIFAMVIPVLAGNNAGQAFSIWPDTGQLSCYSETAVLNPCPDAGDPFYGQDAQYPGPSQSYTKLDANGNELPGSAPLWVMVRDNITGLTWEIKEAADSIKDYANPHDADNTYLWCDTNQTTNYGVAGDCGTNDTEDFLAALNSGTGFGGFSDWRLPTIKEISTLLQDSNVIYSYNTSYFPSTMREFYWTATSYVSNPNQAWYISFKQGYGYNNVATKKMLTPQRLYVMAVRGGDAIVSDFQDMHDGTIVDNNSCLQWQQKTMDVNADGISDKMTWKEALASAQNLSLAGFNDWRLPNTNELRTLIDFSNSSPATYNTFSSNTQIASYWSSSSFSNQNAMPINFYIGIYSNDPKLSQLYVRAVRGTQCGQKIERPRPDQEIDNSIIGTGKKAVVITHGWNSSIEEWAINDTIEDGLADKICKSLDPAITLNKVSSYKDTITLRCSTPDWHVYVYDWQTASQNGPLSLPSGLPMTAYGEAFAQGIHLGNILGAKGYSHVHLLAHSAGANLINTAKDWLRMLPQKPDIHLTFFDAYDPFAQLRCFRQLSAYGFGADWVDNYVDTRTLDDLFAGDLDATKLYMPYAYNVDVTKWDIRNEPAPIFEAAIFRHEWPLVFYDQWTFSPMNYDLGYQLSMEGGGVFPPSNRTTGKTCILPNQSTGVELQCQNIVSVCRLETNPEDIHTIGDPDVVIGSITKSVTGVVEIINHPVTGILTYWNFITGSPVWSRMDIELKKPINALEFDYEFLSSSAAEGYLTIFVDDRVVGHVDERYSPPGKHTSYRLYLGELAPGDHTLAIRLEPYTATQSSIQINNLKLINVLPAKTFPWTMFLPAISGTKK